jgi:hypothetical protein
MTLQNVKTFLKTHKTGVIISAAGVIVVGSLTAYLLWSMSTWSQYETVGKEWREELKTDTVSALALPIDTIEKRNQKLAALKAIAEQITAEGNSPCKPHAFLEWQQGMGYAKPKIEECQKHLATLGEFRSSLTDVVTYLENEKIVAGVFADTAGSEKIADKDFAAQVVLWQSADSAISRMTATPIFDPVKTEAANVAKDIAVAWQAVVAANDAKDKKKYEDAVAGLTAAYEGIKGITALSDQKLEPLTRILQEKYEAAF